MIRNVTEPVRSLVIGKMVQYEVMVDEPSLLRIMKYCEAMPYSLAILFIESFLSDMTRNLPKQQKPPDNDNSIRAVEH